MKKASVLPMPWTFRLRQCFVKYSNDDDYKHQVDSAIERYKRKSFNHEISSVLDFIEVFK